MPGLCLEVKDDSEHQKRSTTYAKKALSIGIQYMNAVQLGYSKGDPPPSLQSSHNDPEVLKKILTQFYGFQEKDIVVLKDDGQHTLPTRENILKAIDDLVRDAKAGDHFVFHYSGHGDQIECKDDDGVEEDGMDEVIWPVDIVYDKDKDEGVENYIVDDELKKRLVDSLPSGTHLTVILDCCHSGSGVDLPNSCLADSEKFKELWSPIKSPTSPSTESFPSTTCTEVQSSSELATTEACVQKVNTRGFFKMKLPFLIHSDAFDVFRKKTSFEDAVRAKLKQINAQRISADKYVTSWAACVDADIEVEGPTGGLLTQAFWEVLRHNQVHTHQELVQALAKQLVTATRPAKKYFLQQGWGSLNCPRPVLGSLQKLDDIYHVQFTF